MACAPTGSGKTVLFELAIIRLLMETSEPWRDIKAVYSEQIIQLTLLKHHQSPSLCRFSLIYTNSVSLNYVAFNLRSYVLQSEKQK